MLLCLLISHKDRRGEGKKAPQRGDFAAQNVNEVRACFDHRAFLRYMGRFCLYHVTKDVQNILSSGLDIGETLVLLEQNKI